MKRFIQGLYTIADNTFRPELSHVQLAEAFLKGGAKIVQLRMKENRDTICDIAKSIMALKQRYDFTFIINDDIEVAMELQADGVHVGANDMPVEKVRELVSDKMLVGYSSHSLEEALRAQAAGADYVAFGAIFKTPTKGPLHPVQGLEKLQEMVQALSIPVVAIGGIHRENFQSVLETGVQTFAMISALTKAADIVQETRYYISQV